MRKLSLIFLTVFVFNPLFVMTAWAGSHASYITVSVSNHSKHFHHFGGEMQKDHHNRFYCKYYKTTFGKTCKPGEAAKLTIKHPGTYQLGISTRKDGKVSCDYNGQSSYTFKSNTNYHAMVDYLGGTTCKITITS